MEVGDLELLMLVNNYQQRFNEPTFSTLDDIPEALIIEVLDDAEAHIIGTGNVNFFTTQTGL